jgi:predicted dehydrogenase
VYPGYPRRIELTGSEGTIILQDNKIIAVDLRDPGEDIVRPQSVPKEETNNQRATSAVVSDVSGHRRILEDFLRTIETDGKPVCDGYEGRRSVELVQAIYESSRTGESVTVKNEE